MIKSLFVKRLDDYFRVLLEDENGSWMISCNNPGNPFYSTENLQRCEAPNDLFSKNENLTAASQRKLAAIEPLLNDETCICHKERRNGLVKEIAADTGMSRRTVLRLYYRYLATGSISTSSKETSLKENSEFNWAIRKYYYSAHRYSLKTTYELMLLAKYTDGTGNLLPQYPSWGSFRHYFYEKGFHKDASKIISREGLSSYQRNHRPAFDDARSWKKEIGAYQVDAQEADIHLVSSLDRLQAIGRPYIYMAVDTATEMITGIYVTMKGGEEAVMRLIANAAMDKNFFCKKYGLDISSEEWPCQGIPSEIISDKGADFCSKRIEELCYRYSVQLESVPPFRSELKPFIERSFGTLSSQYLDTLRAKGVIEADAAERWATDYKSQAVLTMEEYTRILILAVLQANSRVLSCSKTPLQLWNDKEKSKKLISVDDHELYLMTLSRTNEKVKLNRTGIRFRSLDYSPENMENLSIGTSYPVAWDRENISEIYLVIENHQYVRCSLTKSSRQYAGLNATEVTASQKSIRKAVQKSRKQELSQKVKTLYQIRGIISDAEEVCK